MRFPLMHAGLGSQCDFMSVLHADISFLVTC